QAPVLPSTHPRLARKVKPFFRFYERETAAYAILRDIDYIYEECPFARGATTIFYKELLNRLEERSRGAKSQFYLSFLRAREKGLFLRRQATERISVDEGLELGECERCGQPTTAPGLCAFCRLWKVAEAEVR
ncbi:MAG: tRNA(Ile)-lysidine synthetase, partial [Anaerolineae bacterium]